MQKKMTIEDTGERVRALREAMGMTQEEFAREIGVTVTQVSRWSNSKATPHLICQKEIMKFEKEYFGDA